MNTTKMAVLAILLGGCGSDGSGGAAAPSTSSYSATATYGDFITISVDRAAMSISYTNWTNGMTGTVPYTLAADGSYEITDPSGNLVTAYEVPGFALVVAAMKTGPQADTPSLILAIEKQPITKAAMANAAKNFMQFRTNSGGMELGFALIDGQSNITTGGYWPYGAVNGGGSAFNSGTMPGSSLSDGPDGTYMILTDPMSGEVDTIFGTTGGFLAVDTPNGSIVCVNQQPVKDFDPAWAGTYKAILYSKSGCTTGMGNVELGTADVDRGTLAIDAAGQVTITDTQNQVVANSTVTPLADNPAIVGGVGLADPCNGLFYFTVGDQTVYAMFLDGALLFSSFTPTVDPMSGMVTTYDYFYGVGLKQ